MEKLYYTAKEVAEMLDVSVSHAYKVIREANRELSSKGFYVRAGRVSRKYLDSKVYDLKDIDGIMQVLDKKCPQDIPRTMDEAWYLMPKAKPYKLTHSPNIYISR